jgi:hypothetical protein
MPTLDAIEAVYGARETKARAMLRSGQDLGMRVLTSGARRWTPTVDVLRLLGLDAVGGAVADRGPDPAA